MKISSDKYYWIYKNVFINIKDTEKDYIIYLFYTHIEVIIAKDKSDTSSYTKFCTGF